MITETYRTLYRIMNDNMQAASKKALPFDEKTGETVLNQQGEAADVSSFAEFEIERYMQAAYCMLFYRPVDQMTLDAAKALLQMRSLAKTKKRMLRKILCSQAFQGCGFSIRGLSRKDALSVSLWRMAYSVYSVAEKGFPLIRRFKTAVKECVRY